MKIVILVIFNLIICGHAVAQPPNWIIYNTANSGLPDNWVTSIEMDSQGNKWFGTVYGGVAKFDNANWQIFNTSNSGLAAHNIQAMHIDSLDNKWFGSGWTGKISKFDNVNWTVYDSANTNGIITNQGPTNDIITDKSGKLLIGTGYYGIRSFDGNLWGTESSYGSSVYDFTLDSNLDLWVGYWNSGAAFYSDTNSTWYTTTNSILPSGDITSIAVESNGIVWLANRYYGLVKIDGSNWTVYNMSNTPSLPSNSFNSVIVDHNDTKWFATGNGSTGWGDGIIKFDDVSWTTYNTSNSNIPSNDVISFSVDMNNNLWMGTQNHGIAAFNENGVILSVKKNNKINEITNVCPNPFNSKIEVRIQGVVGEKMEVLIKDVLGHTVQCKEVFIDKEKCQIELENLSQGLYNIILRDKEGNIYTSKAVKN